MSHLKQWRVYSLSSSICGPQIVSGCSEEPQLSRQYPRHYTVYHIFSRNVLQQNYLLFHLVVCLTTGAKPLPKRALHIVRSRASSFKWDYPFLSLRSSSSFLRLLPCLPVTSIPPCIFPLVTRSRRQFRRKMWPIQFAFRLRVSRRIFLCSLTLRNTSSMLIKRSNLMQQYADIYSLHSHSTCFGCHSTHHQEY